ncbi:hydantoinase/oxoprolinase N-terminal domain-containing protein [Desulfomarina sp.]
MKTYIIGIDTGGTYTDGVLIETDTGTIVTSAKKPTTRFQLSIGVSEVLKTLMKQSALKPEQVSQIAISTTLATNSVVEKRGARVAVFVIGYVKHFRLPVKAVLFVKGGHNLLGEEEESLDIDYLADLIHGLKNEVDSYAVCSAMAIKNPTHELVAQKAITMIDPKPVFCSHRVSNMAGMEERAATAALHAKLMPVMSEFINGVSNALNEHKLTCPIMTVGGNTALLPAEKAVLEAGLTVASGPACSAVFGAAATDHKNCLVVDIGGTTTDITMIKNGSPSLLKDGCRIGSWKTHVEAINMHSGGIGGDSFVRVDENGDITIGPVRVTPLAMKTDGPPVETWLKAGDSCRLIVRRPGFTNRELKQLMGTDDWTTPAIIRKKTGTGSITLEKTIDRLQGQQLLQEYGFTPTDALHVLDIIHIGNKEIATRSADLLGKTLGLNGREFAKKILEITRDKIETLIIDSVIHSIQGKSLTGFLNKTRKHPVLSVNFSLNIPLVGIGGSARYFLPEIAEKLQTTVTFPQHGEVGNAIGAALQVQKSKTSPTITARSENS